LAHFVRYGSAELRDPGPQFEAKWYADEYPEALESGLEPLFHYLEFGRAKGYRAKGPPQYDRWRALFDPLNDVDKTSIARHMRDAASPRLCLVFFFDRHSEALISATCEHLRNQLYSNWHALFFLASDCSEEAAGLLSRMAQADARLSEVRISSLPELCSALKDEALVLFAEGGLLFREHALYMFAHQHQLSPHSRLIYADEDRLTQDGLPAEPRFKPDFSPILFAQEEYNENCFLLTEAEALIRDLEISIGSIEDARFVGKLFKAVVQGVPAAMHIPFVLYHDARPFENKLNCRELAHVFLPPNLPTVSIIIPTRDRIDLLRACLESLWGLTEYPQEKLEIIILDNGSEELDTIEFLEEKSAAGAIRIIRHSDAFNFSRLNNLGVLNSSGDVLLFLNNDIEIIEPAWLRNLIAVAMRPEVGAVGAKLLYDDHTVQHAGVVLGIQGVAAHSFVGIERDEPGFLGLNRCTREVAAVTGACLAIRRSVFLEIGGFDPDFAVAFNDVILCMEARRRGYSNVWLSDAVLIHHESKSRGSDSTPEKKKRFFGEARAARVKLPAQFERDPFYSPNLSLEAIYEFAYPPRCIAPWRQHSRKQRRPRVLMLSSAHRRGYGVAVVLQLQAQYLTKAGFDIIVGGPANPDDLHYDGCTRVTLKTAREAAIYAFRHEIDCIVAHTPPFFSVVRHLEATIPVVFYDYGEPPPDLFPDAEARLGIEAEKRFCSPFAARLLAISEAVRADADEPRMGVVPLGNAHLAVWDPSLQASRAQARAAFGWEGKLVILNVCRFHRQERLYKGIDRFLDVVVRTRMLKRKSDIVFVLSGRADDEDVAEIKSFGIEVFANASDAELTSIYCAADIYANFSKWEGYNLGIGQALAMGLPVIASDIPAHRAFPIWRSNDTDEIVDRLLAWTAQSGELERRPVVTEWEPSLARFAEILRECVGEATEEEVKRVN
jgi:GT2 family glycosyltransferase